jgi:hypothetical protein
MHDVIEHSGANGAGDGALATTAAGGSDVEATAKELRLGLALNVRRALVTLASGHGEPPPAHVWHALRVDRPTARMRPRRDGGGPSPAG